MNARLRRRSGFTLIELMIVVAIVAVLATIAAVAMGRHARSVRLDTMRLFMGSYAAAQEQYATHIVNGSPQFCPPAASIGNQSIDWDASCDTDFWPVLNIAPNNTWFAYYATAGGPADACTAPATPTGVPGSLASLCASIYAATGASAGAAVGADWWVIASIGDQDGDGTYSLHFTTSEMYPEIYSDGATE